MLLWIDLIHDNPFYYPHIYQILFETDGNYFNTKV